MCVLFSCMAGGCVVGEHEDVSCGDCKDVGKEAGV